MTTFRPFLSLLLFGSACVSDETVHNQSQADVLPYGEVTIADAIGRSSTEPCAPSLRVNLLSYGAGLRVETYQHLDPSCEPGEGYPARASHEVKSIEYDAGRLTYLATSPLGALWIHDDRQAGRASAAWTVSTYDYEATLVPGHDPWRIYKATSVDDYNLRATGDNSHWIRVRLEQPLSIDELQRAIYSLVIDQEQSHAVANSNDMAYDLLVITDFPVFHALSQLREHTLVKSADLR